MIHQFLNEWFENLNNISIFIQKTNIQFNSLFWNGKFIGCSFSFRCSLGRSLVCCFLLIRWSLWISSWSSRIFGSRCHFSFESLRWAIATPSRISSHERILYASQASSCAPSPHLRLGPRQRTESPVSLQFSRNWVWSHQNYGATGSLIKARCYNLAATRLRRYSSLLPLKHRLSTSSSILDWFHLDQMEAFVYFWISPLSWFALFSIKCNHRFCQDYCWSAQPSMIQVLRGKTPTAILADFERGHLLVLNNCTSCSSSETSLMLAECFLDCLHCLERFEAALDWSSTIPPVSFSFRFGISISSFSAIAWSMLLSSSGSQHACFAQSLAQSNAYQAAHCLSLEGT